MIYRSTRGHEQAVLAAEAIRRGIAPDGGLFVPTLKPWILPQEIKDMARMGYQARAVTLLKLFLTDFTEEEIKECVEQAYAPQKFTAEDIAPVHKLDDRLYFLELWHGPTCAFKDMALQILPHLFIRATAKKGEDSEVVILVATSGDTGKAALEGFKDVAGTRVIVFYPHRGVSGIQRLQMVTQEGKNVKVVALKGNFDDTQNGVKAIFNDAGFQEELAGHRFKLSSANSINWGRLVPQIIYYFSAYADLLEKGGINAGEEINIVVPTGNFGNILAAFYAQQMGLPVHRLICASNANNVLTDFIRTGVYDRNRPFKKTLSPSMDILISSNLERLLYELTGGNASKVRRWMEELKENGRYEIDADTKKELQKTFWSGFAGDEATLATIKAVYDRYGYVLDPHTAVAKHVYDQYVRMTGDKTKTVIASTASPFKFAQSVIRAILGNEAVEGKDEFAMLEILAGLSQRQIPPGLRELTQKPVRHTAVCTKDEMKEMVREALGL